MLLHAPRERPKSWQECRTGTHPWLVPFVAVDWCFDWVAFVLSRWSFLAVLEYMSSFSILVAVVFYFAESGDRLQQKHYQAWQVINTAQGKGGSGGRIEALQELNEDGVPLVGVDVSGAFLRRVGLPHAKMVRASLDAVDARNSDFHDTDLTTASLRAGNFRDSDLSDANFDYADLSGADLCRANLSGSSLDGATLDEADLGNTDLKGVKWQKIASLAGANVRNVRNAPPGFVDWATQHGAVTTPSHSDCE